jgi:hypothetical protein
MALEFVYDPPTTNDKSTLTEGWHPGFLVAITTEQKPSSWRNVDKAPLIWRWHFALWEGPTLVGHQAPEHQTGNCETKFSPGGGKSQDGTPFSPSKAYVWTSELLNHKPMPGEKVSLDPLMPIPCRVRIVRKGDYANIQFLERWPEGMSLLTEGFKSNLFLWWQQVQSGVLQPAATAPQAPAPVVPQPMPPPALATWGTPVPQTGAPAASTPAKPGW